MMHGDGDVEELTLNQQLGQARLDWQGVPELSYVSHSIALTAWSRVRRAVFHYMINAYWEPLTFELPSPETLPGGIWHRWIDTSRETPEDILPWDQMPTITARSYRLPERSIAVLVSK
jgi:glycogen operon protein